MSLIPANIAQRHTLTGSWPAAVESALRSDFFKVTVVNSQAGDERYCYTSPKSFLVVSQGDPEVYLRYRYPSSGERILDSAHDEQDQSYLLTNQFRLLRYTSDGPGGVSDWPDKIGRAHV